MLEPTITLDEAKAIVATKTAPRVTEDSIKAKIKAVEYHEIEGLATSTVGTLCVITMLNGWMSTGFSAPASPENFDQEVGRRYAYDNAFKQLWQLEGYLLREDLHREAQLHRDLDEVAAKFEREADAREG
jgi:hypothetical protein